mgnify:CR=1 FL=1
MRAVLFVNGDISDPARVRSLVHEDDYLVAADGGARHCLALGRVPHVVVGDLDSLDAHVAAALDAQGVMIERHPVNKDKTDLELALERALRDGADDILMVGALGSRLDQSLANVLLLAQRPWPARLRVLVGHEIAEVVRGGETLTLDAPPGSTVSLLPLSECVRGVTYRGLLYPLEDATLYLGSTRAVSNEVRDSPATVQVGSGLALVVQALP